MTWHVALPAGGTITVTSVGPTFWFGGTVADSNPAKIGGEGFLELQFYPDSRHDSVHADAGDFFVNHEVGTYTACSPGLDARAAGRRDRASRRRSTAC